jgi:hypothetical protein
VSSGGSLTAFTWACAARSVGNVRPAIPAETVVCNNARRLICRRLNPQHSISRFILFPLDFSTCQNMKSFSRDAEASTLAYL